MSSIRRASFDIENQVLFLHSEEKACYILNLILFLRTAEKILLPINQVLYLKAVEKVKIPIDYFLCLCSGRQTVLLKELNLFPKSGEQV
jgi:hypothetical protein